ncbi:MAG: hypothetical protein AABY83_02170 [Pseudomonadota bacterium]
MKLRNIFAALAVTALGLTACAPVSNPTGTTPGSANVGHIVAAIKADPTSGQPQVAVTVTVTKVELTQADGTVVVAYDNAMGQPVTIDPKAKIVDQIDMTNVPDGTYTKISVTIENAGVQKTFTMNASIVVAAGKITNVTIAADTSRLVDHNASDGAMQVVEEHCQPDNHPSIDSDMHKEGKITAIADDKSSITIALEGHRDATPVSLTVNIVTGDAVAENNTKIVDEEGAVITADTLAVGDEVEVKGVLDAETNTLTAQVIEVEGEEIHAVTNFVNVYGAVKSIDATTKTVTVTVVRAKGMLPAGVTEVVVNVADTTKIVKMSVTAPTLADLAVDDKVMVRGTDVLDTANAPTATVDAKIIVVVPTGIEMGAGDMTPPVTMPPVTTTPPATTPPATVTRVPSTGTVTGGDTITINSVAYTLPSGHPTKAVDSCSGCHFSGNSSGRVVIP